MDVNYLIQVLERKIIILNNAKANAFSVGDLDTLNAVDQELLAVQSTLVQLNLLSSVTQAAAASNSTMADMLSAAIQSTQPLGSVGSDIVNGYDIATYATDPSFEQNINNILMAMPAFSSSSDIDAYIQSIAPGSPVTGNMVLSAATTYSIDEPLLVALMQNDSQFGTQGVAVSTLNPGNVGNTGAATQTYASWQDGVSAVAAWLANHRAVVPDAPKPTAVAAIASDPASIDAVPASTITPAASSSNAVASPAVSPASTSTSDASIPAAASSTPSIVTDTDSTAATSTPAASTSTSAIIDTSASSTTPATAAATTTAAAIPLSAASSTADSSTSTSTPATNTDSSGS